MGPENTEDKCNKYFLYLTLEMKIIKLYYV